MRPYPIHRRGPYTIGTGKKIPTVEVEDPPDRSVVDAVAEGAECTCTGSTWIQRRSLTCSSEVVCPAVAVACTFIRTDLVDRECISALADPVDPGVVVAEEQEQAHNNNKPINSHLDSGC